MSVLEPRTVVAAKNEADLHELTGHQGQTPATSGVGPAVYSDECDDERISAPEQLPDRVLDSDPEWTNYPP